MTKRSPNKTLLLSGNEAIGRGALEAGLSLATSYPGTPATEILEYLAVNFPGHAQWAINEKIALETAIGTSYTGRRAICSMKHVGLNVAADPLMTAAYLGTKGGLVIAVADDPGSYSSQNEQDTRLLAAFAKVPCFEPANAQEAKDLTIKAFELSEKFLLPVIIRGVTRLCHTSSPVVIGPEREPKPLALEKNPARMLAIPKFVVENHKILNDKQIKIKAWAEMEKSGLYPTFNKGRKKGIIAAGTAFNYAKECAGEFALLKISFYPIPENIITDFAKGLEELWVLEEGEPLVEEKVAKSFPKVKGKLAGHIPREGELGPEVVTKYIVNHTSASHAHKTVSTEETKSLASLPQRPPVLCPGCPHRDLFQALKAAHPRFVTGDIGCYTLGANPPLEALDTCLCMGASISKAAGIAAQGVEKVAAVIGDSTFLHSGIPALISAVYNKANILVLILDNDTTAMTGHQPTPSTGKNAKGLHSGKVYLEEICRACGAASVEVVDPIHQEKTSALIKEKLSAEGVHVIISRRPCIFVARKD